MNLQGSAQLPSAIDRRFSLALDAIGNVQFAQQLLAYLNKAVQAEHCVLYHFGDDDLEVLGAASVDGTALAGINSERYRLNFWRRDAVFANLSSRICGYASEVACVPTEQITDPVFRHELFISQGLSGRAMLVGDRGSGLYGVSLFRGSAEGFFSDTDSSLIISLADVLVSCVAKHGVVLRSMRDSADLSFASIETIENRILEIAPTLTNRERQVCARMIFGLQMKETAKDLSISPESAVTYRKRAYLRLGVGTRAELVRYLLRHNRCESGRQ